VSKRVPLNTISELASGLPQVREGSGLAGPSFVVLGPRDLTEEGRVELHDEEPLHLPHSVERYKVRAGDVLVQSRGAAGALRVGLVNGELRPAINSSNLIRVRPQPGYLPEVLVAFLLSSTGQKELQRRAVGTSTRALSAEDLGTLEVPLPDLETQKRIVSLWEVVNRAYSEAVKAAEERRAFGVGFVEHLLGGTPLPTFDFGGRR